MRTKQSLKNAIVSVIMNILMIATGFITQRFFVYSLGLEYLGVNGLFANVISMLGIIELGLGATIIYSLYKPIASEDGSTIKSLMEFYKKSYRIIALIVAIIGLTVMPLIGRIVGHIHIHDSIIFIYLLFLLDVVLSYLITYKRSLLYADQKNYIINAVHTGYIVAVNTLQILILLFTANFILYLVAKIVIRVVESIVLNIIVDKRYPILKDKDSKPLDDEIKKGMFIKIRALFLHKVSAFVVLGSDNIIISVFLGLRMVGLYSNYYLVIGATIVVIGQLFGAITASVGNLLVTSTPEKSHEVYQRVRLANFWLAALASISILVSMDSFVHIWLGGRFILPIGVLVALCINLFLSLFRSGLVSFKDAAAIYHEDRFVPILESVVNIFFAIVFLHFFGLAGVFMGTICSTLVLHLYSYPRFVYTRLFKRGYREYYKEFCTYLVVAIVVGAGTFILSRHVIIKHDALQFMADVFISLTIPNVIFYMLYRKSEEFMYYKKLTNKLLIKIKGIR